VDSKSYVYRKVKTFSFEQEQGSKCLTQERPRAKAMYLSALPPNDEGFN